MGIFADGHSPFDGIVGAASTAAKVGGAIGKGAFGIAHSIGTAAYKTVNQIQLNINRPKTPFNFEDGISQADFLQITNEAGSSINRITACRCEGPVARFTVRSQSNITEWEFSVDFNAWGHFTGQYWINSDNSDSKIPSAIANRMSESIKARIS